MSGWLVGLVVLAGCAVKHGDFSDEDAEESEDGGSDEDDDLVGDACANEGELLDCAGDRARYCAITQLGTTAWSECAEHHACQPGESIECVAGGGLYDQECTLDYEGRLSMECGPTPLAIDLGNDGFEFEPAGARAFDIAGDASCLDVDWPLRSTAWLAIDRDGDGAIADGRELFGTGTPMPDRSRPSNGFVALATLDEDLDGAITTRDHAFARLVLWTDVDGDRKGTGDELFSLGQLGIASLPLAYHRDRECDARGNCVVERAYVTTHGGTRALVDLHLACQ